MLARSLSAHSGAIVLALNAGIAQVIMCSQHGNEHSAHCIINVFMLIKASIRVA